MASVTSGVRSFGDSLASEVAGYKGTMVDSESRGSDKLEDSESGLKRRENLVIKVTQELKQEVRQVIKQEFGEIKTGNQHSGGAAGPVGGVQGGAGGSETTL